MNPAIIAAGILALVFGVAVIAIIKYMDDTL